MNKKRNNLIIAIITFLLVGNVYAESTLKDDTNYVTKTYKNIHLAMSDIKDTNLKPTEIINYMGEYLQNGTYYDSSNHDQTYYGLLGDGYAVCAGHNDAARVLTTLAGANCVNVTSASAKHMITSCYYDNDWYYFDATGSATDTNLQLPDKRFDVRAHTDIQYTNIHATFGPIDPKNRWNTWFFGTSEENIAFSALSRISPVPYGQDISYTTDHTFFDKTNRYYLKSKNEERELYRENRTTGSKTKLASTLKNYIIGKTDVSYATGLVKDYDYLYYINNNDRKVYKIKTDGTGNTKVSDKETLNIWRTNDTIYGFNRTDDVFEIGKLSSYPKTGTLNINDGTSSYQIIYAYNNNGATILGVDGINGNTPKGVIQIPENLSGVPVIGIVPRVFYNFDNSIPTESLTLPANLIYIGSDAFNNTNIKKVTFNNKLISIGESAFYNANIEGKITIPDSVTYIGNRAFSNNNIEEEELGNGITVLYENTFSNNKLTKANIPDSLEVYSTTGRGGAFNSNNIENYIFGSKLKYLQLNSSNATTLENLKNVVIESPDLININVNYLDLEKVKFYVHAGTTTATTLTNANIPWINLDALTFNVIPEESEITIDMMKKQKQLKYTVEPSFLEYTEKSWTSSNTSVATVSSKGLVTLKKAGKTTITLTLSTGQTTTFKITVTDNPIKQISFDLPAKLPDGGKYVMQASITPSDADASDLVWTSSNESILKINSYDGKNVNFNTIGGGIVTITITAPNGVKSETQTFVYYPVKSFSLIRPTTMFIGEEYELSYKVTSDGEYYDSFRLTTENPELQINGKKISSNIAGQYTIKVLDHNNKSWGKYNVVFKEKKTNYRFNNYSTNY